MARQLTSMKGFLNDCEGPVGSKLTTLCQNIGLSFSEEQVASLVNAANAESGHAASPREVLEYIFRPPNGLPHPGTFHANPFDVSMEQRLERCVQLLESKIDRRIEEACQAQKASELVIRSDPSMEVTLREITIRRPDGEHTGRPSSRQTANTQVLSATSNTPVVQPSAPTPLAETAAANVPIEDSQPDASPVVSISGRHQRRTIVVSYSTKQREFKNLICNRLSALGFDPWSGEDVRGGRDWRDQWLDKAAGEDTVGLIFILSKSFILSSACMDEFDYTMSTLRQTKGILPVLYENFMLPPRMQMMLVRCNYIEVDPPMPTLCQCAPTCSCLPDGKQPRNPPASEKWFNGRFREGMISSIKDFAPELYAELEMNLKGARKKDHTSFAKNKSKCLKRAGSVANMGAASDEDEAEAWEEMTQVERERMLSDRLQDRLQQDISDEMDGMQLRGMCGIIGSASFFNPDVTRPVCEKIGIRLAETLPADVVMVLGGIPGISEALGTTFHGVRAANDIKHGGTFPVLPVTDPEIETRWAKIPQDTTDAGSRFKSWDYGCSLFYGRGCKELFNVLFNKVGVIIMLEGGPVSKIQATSCEKNGNIVIPVRCTGGFAADREVGSKSPFHKIHKFLESSPESIGDFPWLETAQDAWDLIDDGTDTDPDKIAEAVTTVATAVLTHRTEMKEIDQRSKGVPNPKFKPPNLKLLATEDDLVNYMQGFAGVILFNGHGSAQQFGDMEYVKRVLKFIVADLDHCFGSSNWLAMYGGEPYIADTPTIAHPIRILHKDHKKNILMVQCDEYGKQIHEPVNQEQFEHMADGAAFIYPTEVDLNAFGDRQIMFGGFKRNRQGERTLCGATKYWFGDAVLNSGCIKGHVLLGGGPITVDEATHSLAVGLPIFYSRCEVKNTPTEQARPSMHEWFGRVESWANAKHIPRDTWYPFTPSLKNELAPVKI